MRFNSAEHLIAWRDHGRFPAIHDSIANLAIAHMRGHRLIDLGCSFGLLAHRIAQSTGSIGSIGVDSDAAAAEEGRAAGVAVRFVSMRIETQTLPRLFELIRGEGVDTLIARRVLPELFGDDLPAGREFACGIAAAGIAEIFLEGRVATRMATNPLRSVAEEVALLAPAFREVKRAGAVSYLRRSAAS